MGRFKEQEIQKNLQELMLEESVLIHLQFQQILVKQFQSSVVKIQDNICMLIWVHWPQTQQLWHLHSVEALQIGLGKSKYHKYPAQQDMHLIVDVYNTTPD